MLKSIRYAKDVHSGITQMEFLANQDFIEENLTNYMLEKYEYLFRKKITINNKKFKLKKIFLSDKDMAVGTTELNLNILYQCKNSQDELILVLFLDDSNHYQIRKFEKFQKNGRKIEKAVKKVCAFSLKLLVFMFL